MRNRNKTPHSLTHALCELGMSLIPCGDCLQYGKIKTSPCWKKNSPSVFCLDISPEQPFRKTLQSHAANSQNDMGFLSQFFRPMCVSFFLPLPTKLSMNSYNTSWKTQGLQLQLKTTRRHTTASTERSQSCKTSPQQRGARKTSPRLCRANTSTLSTYRDPRACGG